MDVSPLTADVSKHPQVSNPGSSGPLADERQKSQSLQAPPHASSITQQARRASYAAPMTSNPKAPLSAMQGSEPKRRSTLPVNLLPSLGTLLQGTTRPHFKRQREGIARLYGEDTSDPLSLPVPSAPQAGANIARLMFSPSGEMRGSGNTREKGVNGHGDEKKNDGESSRCVSSDVASAQSEPCAGTKRHFSRQAKEGGGEVGSEERVWNPALTPETAGYVTSAPAPDWRKFGLASVGRVASFNEAKMATRKNFDVVGDTKPRRASAFINHGSTLPPFVSEVGRRGSAFEPRLTQTNRHVPHYSELLSANKPFRSLNSFGCGPTQALPTRQPLVTPDTRTEEKEELVSHHKLSSNTAPGGIPTQWNAPPPSKWLSSREAAAAATEESPEIRLSESSLTSSRSNRFFHVMPATTVYAAELSSCPQGKAPAASLLLPSMFTSHRQFEISPQGKKRWEQQTAGEREVPTATRDTRQQQQQQQRRPGKEGSSQEETCMTSGPECGESRRAAATFGEICSGGGGDNGLLAGRPPRRGSMAQLTSAGREDPKGSPGSREWLWSVRKQQQPAAPSDNQRRVAANSPFSSCITPNAQPLEQTDPSARREVGNTDSSARTGRARRTKALFGGNWKEDRTTSVGGDLEVGRLPHSMVVSSCVAKEGSAPQSRRWSRLGPSTPPLDRQGQSGTAATSYVRAWGAPTDEGAEETVLSPRKDRLESAKSNIALHPTTESEAGR